MTVDKFGHSINNHSNACPPGLPGKGFHLTESGDYNIQFKRLVNIEKPVNEHDAATKEYVDMQIDVSDKDIMLLRKYNDDSYNALKEYINTETVNQNAVVKQLIDDTVGKSEDLLQTYFDDEIEKLRRIIKQIENFISFSNTGPFHTQ